jgi:hypothetical protein
MTSVLAVAPALDAGMSACCAAAELPAADYAVDALVARQTTAAFRIAVWFQHALDAHVAAQRAATFAILDSPRIEDGLKLYIAARLIDSGQATYQESTRAFAVIYRVVGAYDPLDAWSCFGDFYQMFPPEMGDEDIYAGMRAVGWAMSRAEFDDLVASLRASGHTKRRLAPKMRVYIENH